MLGLLASSTSTGSAAHPAIFREAAPAWQDRQNIAGDIPPAVLGDISHFSGPDLRRERPSRSAADTVA
jgi:hypothetical protein